MPLLRHLVKSVVEHGVVGVEIQLFAKNTSSPLREAHRSLIAGHGPASG